MELGYNEELRTEILTERENVMLYQVLGYHKREGRKRLLGYCFLYLGTPIIHDHTWYLCVAYSQAEQTGYKDWNVLYADPSIRLVQAGIGDIDYFLTYRGKTEEHDKRGLSDGAVRMATRENWKDGL
jgi:hypothetical protein